MIKCKELGTVEITGAASDVLAEYCFITSRLARAVDKDEVAKVFLAGAGDGHDHALRQKL